MPAAAEKMTEDFDTYRDTQFTAEIRFDFKIFFYVPRVDVMITIFCDFRPFSAKKLAFFSKTNVMIKIFAKTSFVWNQKRQFFR
jgi:hypothetical protein